MTDYHESKSQPVTREMVWKAYWKVRANKGSAGIDNVSLTEFDKGREKYLYKIWNRLTSGCYFPPAVKQVSIPKKDGGERKLGIPTVSDRIAQMVVKQHLEPKVDGSFHTDSYGYRPGKNAHQALEQARYRSNRYGWVVDLDIKGFFDNIDHDLLLKGLRCYTQETWVLMYIERWLKAPVCKPDGSQEERDKGTPQGGVISPLLANIFLHFVFDKWMEQNYETVKFERYADDIIVHCSSKKQAMLLLTKIRERIEQCKLELHPIKTKLVFCKSHNNREKEKQKHHSFDFLSFTFKPVMVKTRKAGFRLLMQPRISQSSYSKIVKEICGLKLHKRTGKLSELARIINPKLRGWQNYFCKFSSWSLSWLWCLVNRRLTKWVKWNKGYFLRRSVRWLKRQYALQPNLFVHWSYVKP